MDLLVLAGCHLVIFYLAWVGYIGSDDWVYIQNARQREVDPFMVGLNHWDVRVLLTWPMALSFMLFGESEYSAVLPTLIYSFLTSVVAFLYLKTKDHRYVAIVIALLIASSPLLAVDATSIRIDTVETFYVIASLMLFLLATQKTDNSSLLILVGMISAFAFSTRPTSIALVAFYGLLFIFNYQIHRSRYLFIAIGFVGVWASESIFYLFETGTFFHRFKVDFNHDNVVRAGGFYAAVIVEPLKMLLGSHNFGLTFWLFPFSIWYWINNKSVDLRNRNIALYFSAFCVVWIVIFSGFANKLVLDPRYLAPATVAALIAIGLWLVALAKTGRRRLAVVLIAILFASHAIGVYVENKDFLYSDRWLVRLAQQYNVPIYTDPQTYERGLFLFELNDLQDKLIAAPAPNGALFLAVPENAARGSYNGEHWSASDYRPGDWPVVERLDPGRKSIGIALEALGMRRLFSASQWSKINYPNPPLLLYRRP